MGGFRKQMFTGIVETIGVVKLIQNSKGRMTLGIMPKKRISGTKLGSSVAINGVCLTVSKIKDKSLYFDVIPQTLRSTNLGELKKNSKVNLERALRYGDRLDGHYVLGHIESIGLIKKIIKNKKDIEYRISYPKKFKQYVIEKGCIAIDGISLTVAKLHQSTFSVCLIPHTLKITNLQDRSQGDKVNIETDILLKKRKLPRVSR